MYFNLSLKNVRRSIKDYTIYFLTLTFAVCIFYTFNSLSSQKVMFELSSQEFSIIDNINNILSTISIFISIVLGFLIIYANNFLIKRRKKELAVYMCLGMSKRKISFILLIETFIIGLFSLAIGLLLGIFLSQLMSLLTAKLFVIDIKQYKFVFSNGAAIKTLLYFGIIFLFVMLFNTMVISKYKLISLLNAHRKNEPLKIKNIYLSIILFIISIICLGFAYHIILNITLFDRNFFISIALGVVGTFLFFIGLSGFILKLIQANKNIYLKNLNAFVLRQLNSKINTHYFSMTIICLMLFFTITALSTCFSFKTSTENSLKNSTPYSASLSITFDGQKYIPIDDLLKSNGLNINDYSDKYCILTEYLTDQNLKSLLMPYATGSAKNMISNGDNFNISAISISDFNKALKLQGKKEYTLNDDEILFLSNTATDLFKTPLNKAVKEINSIKVNNKDYKIKIKKIIEEPIETNYVLSNFITFILPDNAVKNLPIHRSIINLNYDENSIKTEETISDFTYTNISLKNSTKDKYFLIGATKNSVFQQNKGLSTLLIYIGIYLGIIFLISSAAVIALQQLSEATDNANRYSTLRKIGADKKMINRALFTQILIYFMVPISLAIVHSLVGIKFANMIVSVYGSADILIPSLLTALSICIIYFSYFLATYFGCKNIIKDNR